MAFNTKRFLTCQFFCADDRKKTNALKSKARHLAQFSKLARHLSKAMPTVPVFMAFAVPVYVLRFRFDKKTKCF